MTPMCDAACAQVDGRATINQQGRVIQKEHWGRFVSFCGACVLIWQQETVKEELQALSTFV
jgi:hypothetical protein